MFKSLFGRKDKDPLSARMIEITSDFENKNFDKVISGGESIVNEVTGNTKKDLLRHLGVACFQTNDFDKAIAYFNQLAEGEDNPDHLFNLSTSYILNQEPEKGIQKLDEAIALYQEKGKRENMPISYMIFYVICALVDIESYDLAYQQLDRLSIIYREISVTDTHYLYTRGYVPFSNLIEKVKVIMENRDLEDALSWLTEFSDTLDENGKIEINDIIEDLKAENEHKSE